MDKKIEGQREEFMKGEANMQCDKCGYDGFNISLIDYGFMFECITCGHEHKQEQ